MKNALRRHYIFFVGDVLPKPGAHLVQTTNAANAAANLGYSTFLTYYLKGLSAFNPIGLIYPFASRKPNQELRSFFNLQEKLKVAPLAMPWPIDHFASKLTDANTIASKYYFPVHILPTAKLVHTRDWNVVKAAVKQGVAAIYERDHNEQKPYEPEIVGSPLFQMTVTVADTVRENMIQHGMPPEKIIKMHNGFNRVFSVRQPAPAAAWRQKLLNEGRQHLVVYAGALYPFKGVDLLIDVAKELPTAQFAFAGGDELQVEQYQQLSKEKQVTNVTFLGHLPHQKLASLLQAADVLAHPHCSGEAAKFTSPMKFFDYLAVGTPIVATEIPPLMEFKSGNVVAGWCEPDNPRQFTECLKQVLATHPRKADGYAHSIDFVRQFSWENRAAKILSCVEDSMRPPLMN